MSECGSIAGYFRHRRAGDETCRACRDAMREYVTKSRPPVLRLPCAGGCGKPTRHSRSGVPGTCRACLSAPQFSPRQRKARAKLRKAARGTRSKWAWIQGECASCGDYFLRHHAASPYCSKRCARHARGKWISRTDRLAIYERDGWRCQLCGEQVDINAAANSAWSPTLDHITPRSRGGSDDPENLRLAHRWCNSVRGDETYYTVADLAA